MWLNNCIGSKNYTSFFTFMCVTMANLLITVSMLAMELHNYSPVFYELALSIIVLDSLIAFCLGYLIVYHSWLCFNHITTY